MCIVLFARSLAKLLSLHPSLPDTDHPAIGVRGCGVDAGGAAAAVLQASTVSAMQQVGGGRHCQVRPFDYPPTFAVLHRCRQDPLLSRSAARYILLTAPALLAQATFEVFKRQVGLLSGGKCSAALSPACQCCAALPCADRSHPPWSPSQPFMRWPALLPLSAGT